MIDLKLVHEYTKNLHVLYVEDNEALRDSTVKVLNNFFKEVHVAVDGQDGLDKYKTFKSSTELAYDLIISDINMPHKNGIEMSADILKIEPTQSIIFITAHNEAEYLHKAISLGISSFLLKPLNLQDLATVLYKVCQAITDRKLVAEHYEMMEDVNQQLENQNQALEAKNREQEKLIRLLDTMQVKTQQKTDTTATLSNNQPMLNAEEDESYHEQIQQLLDEDLPELREIHEELDSDIITIIAGDSSYIPRVSELFTKYASLLGMYSAFDKLTASMGNLTSAMNQSPLPVDENKTQDIFMFLEAFMYILGKWQKDLQEQTDEKVNRLDVSIIGDIETITNMWLSEENEEVEFF